MTKALHMPKNKKGADIMRLKVLHINQSYHYRYRIEGPQFPDYVWMYNALKATSLQGQHFLERKRHSTSKSTVSVIHLKKWLNVISARDVSL